MSVIGTMAHLEALIKSKQDIALPILFNRNGVVVTFYRTVGNGDAQISLEEASSPASMDSVYNAVYGPYGNLAPQTDPVTGSPNQTTFQEVILLPQFTYTPADETFAGDFEDHYIVSQQTTQIRPEDRFFINRADNVMKGWKVLEKDVIGMTVTTLQRWKVSAILDGLGV